MIRTLTAVVFVATSEQSAAITRTPMCVSSRDMHGIGNPNGSGESHGNPMGMRQELQKRRNGNQPGWEWE